MLPNNSSSLRSLICLGFQNQNNPTQVPSWQNPPNTQFGGIQSPQSGVFQGQNTQNFAQQQQQKPLQSKILSCKNPYFFVVLY